MKRKQIKAIAVLLVLLALAAGGTVYAEELWSEAYYRAYDPSGILTEAEMESLDADYLEFMRQYHLDFAAVTVTPDQYEGSTIADFAEEYYYTCEFGYGPDRDGFQMVWDTELNMVTIAAFGAAEESVPEEYLSMVENGVLEYQEEYGIMGPMYAACGLLENYLEQRTGTDAGENAAADEAGSAQTGPEEPETEEQDPSARVGEGSSLPAWYPADPEHFPMYQDDAAPRVVDTADLYTEEEESTLRQRILEIREELDRDIVIVTDMSAYGLDHSVFAADFYDFNGYGCGPEREGVCLFICMDPNDRGWWTCCTGTVTRECYTEEAANEIDDILYVSMAAGAYYDGTAEWLENIRRLCRNGSPYNQDWWNIPAEQMERHHDTGADRVVDEAGMLTEEERERLEKEAGELSARYGVDVGILTCAGSGSLAPEEYTEKYYISRGYGAGEDYSGILVAVYKKPGDAAEVHDIYASGTCAEKLTGVNERRLINRMDSAFSAETVESFSACLKQTGHMLKTGRAPRSAGSWAASLIFELLIGLAVGFIALKRAEKKMVGPNIETRADAYLVEDSLQIRKVKDQLLDTTRSRVYSPVKTDSDDSSDSRSSSGSSSSYSSSYSGSSGTSHSGSGRRF